MYSPYSTPYSAYSYNSSYASPYSRYGSSPYSASPYGPTASPYGPTAYGSPYRAGEPGWPANNGFENNDRRGVLDSVHGGFQSVGSVTEGF